MSDAERLAAINTAHGLVGRTCESWRRSLLVDGPTGHLHHIECTRVAGLAADLAEAVRLLRMVRWEGHLTAMVCPACSVSMGDASDEHPPGDCPLAAFLARVDAR